jgi:hypothetical protein
MGADMTGLKNRLRTIYVWSINCYSPIHSSSLGKCIDWNFHNRNADIVIHVVSVRTYGSIHGTTTAIYSLHARGDMYITTLSLRTKRESSNQQVVNRTTLIAHLRSYAFGRTHPIPGQPTCCPFAVD